MMEANEKPEKTHDRLIKELNRLKTDLNNEGDIDTDVAKRQLRSRMLVAPTPRVPSPRETISVDTTGLNSNIAQTEQDSSSPWFNSFKNEGSHKDVKGCKAKITKSKKTNKKPSPPFKSIKTCKHQLETQKNQFQGWKSGNQYSNTPKNQDNKDLEGLYNRMMNDDAHQRDTVIDPPPNQGRFHRQLS